MGHRWRAPPGAAGVGGAVGALAVALLLASLTLPASADASTDAADAAAERFAWEIPGGWRPRSLFLDRMLAHLSGAATEEQELLGTWRREGGGSARLGAPILQLWFQPVADPTISPSIVRGQETMLRRQLAAMKGGDMSALRLTGTIDADASAVRADRDRHLLVLDVLLEQPGRRTRVVQAMLFAHDGILRVLAEVPEEEIAATGAEVEALLASLAVDPAFVPRGTGPGGLDPSTFGALVGAAFGLLLTVAEMLRRRRRALTRPST